MEREVLDKYFISTSTVGGYTYMFHVLSECSENEGCIRYYRGTLVKNDKHSVIIKRMATLYADRFDNDFFKEITKDEFNNRLGILVNDYNM